MQRGYFSSGGILGATWSAREDRIPSLVWLAVICFGMVAGFGVDMPRFLHESPPPAAVVDVHAVVFTVWLLLLTVQVLLVVGDRVALHRRLGWFMAGWAGLMVVLGVWTAMVAKAPVDSGPPVPSFSRSTLVHCSHLSFLCPGALHFAGIPLLTSG